MEMMLFKMPHIIAEVLKMVVTFTSGPCLIQQFFIHTKVYFPVWKDPTIEL